MCLFVRWLFEKLSYRESIDPGRLSVILRDTTNGSRILLEKQINRSNESMNAKVSRFLPISTLRPVRSIAATWSCLRLGSREGCASICNAICFAPGGTTCAGGAPTGGGGTPSSAVLHNATSHQKVSVHDAHRGTERRAE